MAKISKPQKGNKAKLQKARKPDHVLIKLKNKVPGKKETEDHPSNRPGDIDLTTDKKLEGCIRCLGNPVPTGDLTNKIKPDGLSLLVDCDQTWRQLITCTIDWKNSNDSGPAYSKDKSIQNGHASAFFKTQTFDAFVDTITRAMGRMMALPTSITSNGLKTVDDIIRTFRDEMNALINGKEDLDLLVGEVDWRFEVNESCTLKVFHFQRIEGYAQGDGLWNFDAKVLIDGNKSDSGTDLPIIPEENKTEPNKPLIPGKESFRESTLSMFGSLSKSTAVRQDYRVEEPFTVGPGRMTLNASYVLKAGFGGILSKENKDKINAAVESANKAIDAFMNIVKNQPTGTALSDAVKKLLEDAAKVATDAFTALIAILNTLVNEVIGYIKLHRTILRLECSGHKDQ